MDVFWQGFFNPLWPPPITPLHPMCRCIGDRAMKILLKRRAMQMFLDREIARGLEDPQLQSLVPVVFEFAEGPKRGAMGVVWREPRDFDDQMVFRLRRYRWGGKKCG